jgi:hypothetical protein
LSISDVQEEINITQNAQQTAQLIVVIATDKEKARK